LSNGVWRKSKGNGKRAMQEQENELASHKGVAEQAQ
jgi:hypothetical protein